MQYIIASTVIAIVLFLTAFLGFKEGLRMGLMTANKTMPPKTKNPIAAILDMKQDIEISKEEREFNKEMQAFEAYNGDLPKE
jgi:Mg2+/citrate symporter